MTPESGRMLVLLFAGLLAQTVMASDIPLVSTGPEFSERSEADGVVKEFQKKWNLPGVSVAISYNNKVVYSTAIGYSDQARSIPMLPTTRFRIASVSKTITSIALMKLYEQRKFGLDDAVFGEGGILGTAYGEPVLGTSPARVTVRTLLNHTSGGWGNSGVDPMFLYSDRNGKDLIETVLKAHPLRSAPGSSYEYSNFGYYVLGRVIERLSGQPYETFVRTSILEPLGATGMRIGSDTSGVDESHYFRSTLEDPYLVSPQHMDSHGGWVATPVELLKLLSGINQFTNGTKVLGDATVKLMTTSSAVSKFYAFGLAVNSSNNWWHMGSLPGVSSEIGRSNDGFCWAILINYRPAERFLGQFNNDLDALFWSIRSVVSKWPQGFALY